MATSRERSTRSDAFVYLDTPEFAWAQDVAGHLEADYDDVAVIEGLEGFGHDRLLAFDADPEVEPDYDHDWNPEAIEIDDTNGLDIVNRNTGEVIAYWHVDYWHGGVPDVPVGGEILLGGNFKDEAERVLPLGGEYPFEIDARLAEGATEGIVEIESEGDRLTLVGQDVGETAIVFQLRADGEVRWETSEEAIAVQVVPELDGEEVDEFYDPHVWVDPVLAGDVIHTIVEGLSEIDPDNAETFEERAEEYGSRFKGVYEGVEDLVADAERTTAVLAGHDAFRYLDHRYGFEIHTPTGVSPKESPSPGAIAETINIVDEAGVGTILYDSFGAPEGEVAPLAETVVKNSSATGVAPLSPAEGTTSEWVEEGWGWVEQMEEINLPLLADALGATSPGS